MKMKKEALLKHRHMSFIHEEYGGYQKFEAFKGAKCLRTFLAASVGEGQGNWFYLSSKILVELLPEFPMLRVLSLSHFEISEVPEVIGGLKHLRYLNLAKTKITELPENVGNLYNLQTLILFGCKKLKKLPKNFLKLKKLRHFDIRDTPLEKLPLGIGEMENLQTLTKIIIGGEGDFTITKLKGLKNLNGKICIEGLHEVKSAIDARESKLSLKRITELELIWGGEFEDSPSTLEKEVLDELKPNSNKLKNLRIKRYGGIGFPKWIGDPIFDQLVRMSIDGCKKCANLPPLGQLPSLKELFIRGMDEVKVIVSEFTGTTGVTFPSLEVLVFKDMRGWEVCTFNSEAGFPSLRELKVNKCPNLIDFSVTTKCSLKVLKIYKCGAGVLRSSVRAVSSITELEISHISGLTDEVWRGVTEYLGAAEKLKIEKCNKIRYLWESEAEASKVFLRLKELEVQGCSELVSLGERDTEVDNSLLSSLMRLRLSHCDNMEFCCCPVNIETLDIMNCSSLTRVSFPKSTTGGGGQKLKALMILHCEKLTEDINKSMFMLEEVNIQGWRNLKSIFQLSSSIHLTSLIIHNYPGIESFPVLQLPNLACLIISSCQSLKSVVGLQLQNLNSLTYLKITNCPSIDSFPCGVWPPRLVTLQIGGLKKPIPEWSPQDFPNSIVELWLHNEDVGDFSHLSHLLPPSLTRLGIDEFDKLESLSMGLQHLTALQHLIILKCPKMIHLPETLLPSLLSLKILDSPELKKMCEGRGSHYWPHISHIPCIRFEYPFF